MVIVAGPPAVTSPVVIIIIVSSLLDDAQTPCGAACIRHSRPTAFVASSCCTDHAHVIIVDAQQIAGEILIVPCQPGANIHTLSNILNCRLSSVLSFYTARAWRYWRAVYSVPCIKLSYSSRAIMLCQTALVLNKTGQIDIYHSLIFISIFNKRRTVLRQRVSQQI